MAKTTKRPLRLALAQTVCGRLPPLIAQRARALLYPRTQSIRDDYGFECRSKTGGRFASTTRLFSAYPFAVHGYFEWRNVAIAAAVASPGDTIVEVGANIGTETVAFADIVGTHGLVIAFEPVEEYVIALKRLTDLNPHHSIRIEPCAVSDSTGEATLVRPKDSETSASAHLEWRGAGADSNPYQRDGERSAIEIVTLDQTLPQVGELSAIFVDTDGYDAAVVRVVSAART